MESIKDGAVAKALEELDRVGRDGGDLFAAWNELSSALTAFDGFPAFDPRNIYLRLAPLAFDVREAILQMAITRLVNNRVQNGFYRDRLVLLATQEKSSSTLHEIAINEMLRHSAGVAVVVPSPRQQIAGPSDMGGSYTFHFSMLLFFPNGGTCRGVFDPKNINLLLVEKLGSRWVVLVRHPADRIVAQYCMRSGELTAAAHSVNTLTPFQMIFRNIGPPYQERSLRDNLHWLAGWKAKEADGHVLVVRYEDMMSDMEAHFAKIHGFLFGTSMSTDLLAALQQHFASSGKAGPLQSGDASTRVYEKGYSGKVGVWQDYLTSQDIIDFNKVAQEFLDSDEDAAALNALYPDLLLR